MILNLDNFIYNVTILTLTNKITVGFESRRPVTIEVINSNLSFINHNNYKFIIELLSNKRIEDIEMSPFRAIRGECYYIDYDILDELRTKVKKLQCGSTFYKVLAMLFW